AWIAVFVYDNILFFLTAFRTFRYYFRTRSDPGVLRVPLLSLTFRDGAMYFGRPVFFYELVNVRSLHLYYEILTLGFSISVTMMCRLMVNLHATADKGLSTRPSDPRRTLTECFDNSVEFAVGGDDGHGF
ncbi:hypothetical protein L218DRAFT_866694, partial [Marasmius fiardii PR-910]